MATPRNRGKRHRVSLRGIIIVVTLAAVLVLGLLHATALRLPQRTSSDTTTTTTETKSKEAAVIIPKDVPPLTELAGPEVHVVFSTDCGSYQHWQSIAVWYSARYAGHQGAVTRIASGCKEPEKAPIEKEYREIDETGDFRVHFAPKGELKGNYKYSNKPSGLYHWLRTAVPAPFRDERTGIVALLDPDQILMRPLTAAVGVGLTKRSGDTKSLYDATGQPRLLVGSVQREEQRLPARVTQGHPVGQEYGLGGAWANSGKPDARPSWKKFSLEMVCGEGAPCTKTRPHEADSYYSVGPPYLIQATDARNLAHAWLEAVPLVHAQYPYLLAEMYAYSMAAANLSLPHAQIHNLMISNVQAGGEGWDWIDGMAPEDVCKGASLSTPPTNTRTTAQRGSFSNDDHAPGPAAPSVLHFCQSYRAAGFKFGKHSVPHDIFSCDQGIFVFEPDMITKFLVDNHHNVGARKANIRNAYFLCNVLPRLNSFILDFKATVCPKRGISKWNTKPTVHA